MKYCRFMDIDPNAETNTPSLLWSRKRTLRPSSGSPQFTPSEFFNDLNITSPTSPAALKKLATLYPAEDIRRKMISIHFKSLNTMGDRKSFDKMLNRLVTPDVLWESQYIGHSHPYSAMSLRLDGRVAVSNYYETLSYMAPDAVVHCQCSDIFLQPDGSAVIVIQSLAIGTKIFRTQFESRERIAVDKTGQAMGVPRSSSQSTVVDTTSIVTRERLNVSTISDTIGSYVSRIASCEASQAVGQLTEGSTHTSENDFESMVCTTLLNEIDWNRADQMEKLDWREISLLPGEKAVKIVTVNLSVNYTRPFHNLPAHIAPEDAGKIYKVKIFHTAAVESVVGK